MWQSSSARRAAAWALRLSSPANRALHTAAIFMKKLKLPEENFRVSADLYHSDAGNVLSFIAGCPNNIHSLMIFGHNPGFTDLANYLTGGNIYNIPTCGVVALQFDLEHWEQIGAGKGKIVFFDYPKKNNQNY